MLAVNQWSTRHVASDCQLKKNGAASAPACIATIHPTTIQSTLFQRSLSGSHASQMGVASVVEGADKVSLFAPGAAT